MGFEDASARDIHPAFEHPKWALTKKKEGVGRWSSSSSGKRGAHNPKGKDCVRTRTKTKGQDCTGQTSGSKRGGLKFGGFTITKFVKEHKLGGLKGRIRG